MERWRGRVALVTGASAGIGIAIAEELARNGMRVIACARNIGEIHKLRDGLPDGSNDITAIQADLTNQESILNLFKEIEEKFGHVDILVNNAGCLNIAPLSCGKTESWKQMLDLNVLGVSICTREALRLMFKDGVDDGHIININSVVGHFINDIADTHFYSATKHIITALTKALNAELRQKKSKIRVTSISPGITETPLMSRLGEDNDKFKIGDWSDFLKGKDIADAVLYVVGAPPHVNIRELTIAEIGFAGC